VGDVEGAMQTPDGAWRVEIVRHDGNRWYRIVTGDRVLDWLSIAAVERILDEAGVDRHTLVEVDQRPDLLEQPTPFGDRSDRDDRGR
jgi:hypothetical protein